MEKKLYEIEADLLATFAKLEENEGELTPELEEELKISREELQEKLIGYAKYIRSKELEIETRQKEIDRLSKMNEREDKSIDFLKERMKFAMKQFQQKEIKTALFKISISSSKFVDITNEGEIPKEYLTTPAPPKPAPDKKKIKEFLESQPEQKYTWAQISTREKVSIK